MMGFRHISIAIKQREEQTTTYKVLSMTNEPKETTHREDRLFEHPYILAAAKTGKIQMGNISTQQDDHLKTQRYTAVPVPEIMDPEFILLLCDPINSTGLTKMDIPYLSQLSSTFWNSIEKNRE